MANNTDYTRLLDGNTLVAIRNHLNNNYVKFTSQTLTDAQKKQARINIGANIEIVDLTTL